MTAPAHLRPHSTRRRVIIDTDAKNEADDQFAIVHALLSPSLDVRGLIPAHFGTGPSDQSLAESRAEIDLLLDLMELTGQVTIADGAATNIPDEETPLDSLGAQLIIAESKAASTSDPLYVSFLGPLTDMASALLLDPELATRDVIVVWIGGHSHFGDASCPDIEFNLSNDIAAANVVFDSGVTVWQVPSDLYSQVSVSYAELEERLRGTSRLGDYLIDQLVAWNQTWHRGPIESRSLGDSPAIALMLYPLSGNLVPTPAPRFDEQGRYVAGKGHPLHVCESVDVRFLLEDMFAKIRQFGRRGR